MSELKSTREPPWTPARPEAGAAAWEVALAAVLLVGCLLGGLALADTQRGGPAVGVLRFAATIDGTTARQAVELVEAARLDPAVAALVLEIASPGGGASSSELLFYTLLNFRQHKPLVVVIDELAASGGYYLAVAGNRIYAPPSSHIGNIGTRGKRPSDPTLAPEELSSGPYKLDGGSRFEQIHQLDLARNAFLNNVVAQRAQAELVPLQISAAELAEARLYLGSEALALGLIDGHGSRAEGVEAAAELAGLESYQVVDLPAYLGQEPITESPTDSAQALLAEAPPGTILMLDTRVPFPEQAWPANLLSLRKARGRGEAGLLELSSSPAVPLPPPIHEDSP